MRKIAENNNKSSNNEQENEDLDGINTVIDEKEEQNAKDNANKVNEKGKKVLKNKKVIGFIVAHLAPILTISVIIIIIIWLIGVFAFFTNVPGTLLEKVKQFGKNIWGEFSGFFTGDTVTGKVTEEDIISLAQYIQSMGYEDLESCGFGDIEYEDDNNDATIKTNKQIKKINKTVDGKNYLKTYIAANESTWALSNWSVWGALNNLGSTICAAIKMDSSLIKSNQSFSTGMINILNYSEYSNTGPMTNIDPIDVKVDRQNEKLIIYTKRIFDPIKNLFGHDSVKWGSTFSYDMSSWTAKYGKPTELFLSIHLSTMMPDLAYEIATNKELNTKVNIVLQDVDMKYDVTANQNINNEEIINAFLDYGLSGDEYQDKDQNETVNVYDTMLQAVGNDQEARNEFFKKIMDQIDESNPLEIISREKKKVNIKAAMIDDSTILGSIREKAAQLGGFIWDTFFNDPSKYYAFIRTDETEVPGLEGINFDDLLELAEIVAKGMGDGIQDVKWPYIQSVTDHWFYNDIDFTKGVYRKAKTAKKIVEYEPRNDEEESAIVRDGVKVQLDATFTADEGVVYQVCEPETSGPNPTIINIFKDKYYKYDGTQQTAKAIENAKRYGENGGQAGVDYNGVNVETPTVEKQEVSFEENKVNALTTFSILENMHSEEGDFVYRCLKELMLELDYFNEEDLTEELKDMLLWLIEVAEPGGEDEEFDVTRDPSEYGILIKDLNNRTVIAPENCQITSGTDESGESVVTLTFTGLSDETVELLEYIYEDDFKIINKDAIVGVTMKIKGMTLDSRKAEQHQEVRE